MIYDCFCFNGEHDLLKIRLAELSNLGDQVKHILIESKYTFTGIEKPFRFVSKLNNNVTWIPFAETPDKDPWVNETRTRNVIKTALINYDLEDSDVVIISDVDEIPRASSILNYNPDFGLCALQQDMYYYWLNGLASKQSWVHPRIMPWKYLKDKTPDQVRKSGFDLVLYNGGWHFTYQGGIPTMLEKFMSFNHQEPEVQKFAHKDVLQDKMDKLESLWGEQLTIVPINDSFPLYVQQNQESLKHLIK